MRIPPTCLASWLRRSAAVTAACAALASPAAAQRTAIEELRPLAPDGTVRISVVAHELVVQGWDRDEIQVLGEYDRDLEDYDLDASERSFRLDIDPRKPAGVRQPVRRLEVRVPRAVRVELQTVSGGVEAEGLSGVLEATAVSGGVTVRGDLAGAELKAVSGSVRYTGNAPTVLMQSVSGGVEYLGRARDVEARAVSGAVLIEGGAETVEAGSVSGSVRILSDVPFRFVEATTVSGSVDVRGRLAPGARVALESHSGSVDLELAVAPDADFELSSFTGRVSAALGGAQEASRERGPGRSLGFRSGDGGARVRASSFSGDVRVSAPR